VNGFNRPYGKPNLWISDKRSENPEWLILDFEDTKEISEVRLYFNSDLGKELTSLRPEKWADSHRIAPQLTLSPQLVKAYTVSVWQEGEWQLVKRVTNNHQRLNVLRFESLLTDRIKIEFQETHGSDYIEVFEVRVY